MALLEIEDLRLEFDAGDARVVALDGVSLSVEPGEIVALVGESGSGKSVTALSVARLLPTPPARYTRGAIRWEGQDVLKLPERALRPLRGRGVGYVFQDPGASLNPVRRMGDQVEEILRVHRPEGCRPGEGIRLLERVGIPAAERRARDYAHQFSGGMQQRVALAMALAAQPRLLVADEPTTALDVTIQAQVIDLLAELRRETGMAILLITHNLGLARGFADRVLVMYAGQVIESGPADAVLGQAAHPYTRGLLRSVPSLGQDLERLPAIPGAVPVPGAWPSGCRFHPRCSAARDGCSAAVPAWEDVSGSPAHRVRCPFWREGRS